MDDYLAGLDAAARDAFAHIRDIVVTATPDVVEGTSYGMAALKYQGKPLLGFRAGKHHLSIFPFSPQAVAAVRDRLGGFDVSKGTVRFTAERPLPDDVVRALVTHRIAEIARTQPR